MKLIRTVVINWNLRPKWESNLWKYLSGHNTLNLCLPSQCNVGMVKYMTTFFKNLHTLAMLHTTNQQTMDKFIQQFLTFVRIVTLSFCLNYPEDKTICRNVVAIKNWTHNLLKLGSDLNAMLIPSSAVWLRSHVVFCSFHTVQNWVVCDKFLNFGLYKIKKPIINFIWKLCCRGKCYGDFHHKINFKNPISKWIWKELNFICRTILFMCNSILILCAISINFLPIWLWRLHLVFCYFRIV